MWRTDKAGNVAHGETGIWCLRYACDVVSDCFWETGDLCPGSLPPLSSLYSTSLYPQPSHQLFYGFATAPGFGLASSTLVFLLRLCGLLRFCVVCIGFGYHGSVVWLIVFFPEVGFVCTIVDQRI